MLEQGAVKNIWNKFLDPQKKIQKIIFGTKNFKKISKQIFNFCSLLKKWEKIILDQKDFLKKFISNFNNKKSLKKIF